MNGVHKCPQGCWHGRAFCSECFQPRSCGGGASERMLKCSHCGVRTLHIVSGEQNHNDPYDYGVRRDPELEELARQEAFMRGLFDQLGARLRTVPRIVENGKPALYGVKRWVRDDEVIWDVKLEEDLTAAGRVWALCAAWESMTSSNVARWSNPDAYYQGDEGWQWTAMFKPLGTATHIDGKPLFQDHA
jgi:hypothetical protein